MNTLLAAPVARKSAVDTLFTSRSSQNIKESAIIEVHPTSVETDSALPRLDIAKVSIDLNDTQRPSMTSMTRNVSLATLNLLERIYKSDAALWRNPVRTHVGKWGRREIMHVFNGWFHQSTLSEWDRYETFGRCYTCPDPFRNDDPPWTPSFC